ncbi:MAG: TonB-dependent receptor [Flavobacteriales bacterium]|nr:TonB-dependent receptor [Flavobacteriales bacterium]
MIKWILSWVFLCTFGVANAQTITVLDDFSGEAIPWVRIEYGGSSYAVTGSEGTVPMEDCTPADSLAFLKLGYATLIVATKDLAQLHFEVRLKRTPHRLEEAVVSVYDGDVQSHSSVRMETLELNRIEGSGSFMLTDALSNLPGINALSTGVGISKPSIRGLYGNRILTLFSGLRFDNQQWQDEHGLGIGTGGLSRVEIIKGPLSVLYGTEAMGGVINLLNTTPPPPGESSQIVRSSLHSNTRGGNFGVEFAQAGEHSWMLLQTGVTSHCDYDDGEGNRVLNSRFRGSYLKAGVGFNRKRWQSANRYHGSYDEFGFIFGDMSHFFEADPRWSRTMSGPHHRVMLHMVSSENTVRLRRSMLDINAGFQSNRRSEDEGGNQLSLRMQLLTGQYLMKWTKALSDHVLWVMAHGSSMEWNHNFGKRKIVPDAQLFESNLSGYIKYSQSGWDLELGGGLGIRQIDTYLTATVNSAKKEIDPFSQTRWFYSGMAGATWNPKRWITLRANLASGVRAPNLAELSANGLHEGIYTYEIGDPNMTNEQNLNTDIGMEIHAQHVGLSISGFYNAFSGYIYLDPTNEEWFGFPVYRYRQHRALIYGGEISAWWKPEIIHGPSLSISADGLVGRLEGGEYLPYMPANRLKPRLDYVREVNKRLSLNAYVENLWVAAQHLVNTLEQPTPARQLLNAGVGFAVEQSKATFSVKLEVNNALNRAYYDHMSRLKMFGMLNMGRDIRLHIYIKFKNNKNEKS